jgi:hypothetical protein
MSKSVIGLKWARLLEERPRNIPLVRARPGRLGDGVRYERSLAKGLGQFRHGQWWEYRDETGISCCQTDFVARMRDWTVLLECKLTWTEEAEEQLWGLYVPVVSRALQVDGGRVLPVVVCKNLAIGMGRPICGSLQEALVRGEDLPSPFCSVWHHIGGMPILRSCDGKETPDWRPQGRSEEGEGYSGNGTGGGLAPDGPWTGDGRPTAAGRTAGWSTT